MKLWIQRRGRFIFKTGFFLEYLSDKKVDKLKTKCYKPCKKCSDCLCDN